MNNRRPTNTRGFLCGLVLAAGTAGLAASAHGQVRPESPMVAARKQVDEALKGVNAAKVVVEQAKLKVTATFKVANPDYAKAEADLAKAKQEVEAAKLAAQAAARKKPEYLAAATAKAKAQEEARAAGQAGAVPDVALSTEIARQASAMSRMEAQALETDTRYLEAKAKNAESAKALEVFKVQLDEAYKADPEYTAAEQAMVQAQTTHLSAIESMRATQKSEAAARAAESKARSEASKSK